MKPKPLEAAILYITREDWARHQAEFEHLAENFESLKVQLLADGALPWLGRSVDSLEAVNLLQGEFARTTDYGARWQRWRLAAVLAGCLLCVHVVAQALQIRQGKHAGRRLGWRDLRSVCLGHAFGSEDRPAAPNAIGGWSAPARPAQVRSIFCVRCRP